MVVKITLQCDEVLDAIRAYMAETKDLNIDDQTLELVNMDTLAGTVTISFSDDNPPETNEAG